MNHSAAYACSSCDRDISFFFEEGQEVDEDDIACPICFIQKTCEGVCGITDEDTSKFNVRVVARVIVILDMIQGLDESLEIVDEMFTVGTTPKVGMDVDLSEHHITSEVVSRLGTVGSELGGVQRALVRTLPDVLQAHHAEASYAINHHPMGHMVHHELARMAS